MHFSGSPDLVGTGIMLMANPWLAFMFSPRGSWTVGRTSRLDAITNYSMPINMHGDRERRLWRFGRRGVCGLQVPDGRRPTNSGRIRLDRVHRELRRDHLLPSASLPGGWLAKEIYAYSQTLGLTMMGGAFSWLFIIQAVLIGIPSLAADA